jgi:hypothetical protein
MTLGGIFAPARLMAGSAETPLLADGITLVQLAGIANGPNEAAWPRLPNTPAPSDPSEDIPYKGVADAMR